MATILNFSKILKKFQYSNTVLISDKVFAPAMVILNFTSIFNSLAHLHVARNVNTFFCNFEKYLKIIIFSDG